RTDEREPVFGDSRAMCSWVRHQVRSELTNSNIARTGMRSHLTNKRSQLANKSPAQPPTHRASWDDIQMPSGAASSGRRGRGPGARKHSVRSACEGERLTTVTHRQSWSLDGCRHESHRQHLCWSKH